MVDKVETVPRMKDKLHSEAMAEQFRTDAVYAVDLLFDVLSDGSPAELAILLRHLAVAFGACDKIQDDE